MTTLTETTTVDTSSGPVVIRHRPEMAVSTNNGAAWIKCTLCERGDYAARFTGKSHKSFCDLRGLNGFAFGPAKSAPATTVAPMTAEELRAASDRAAATGLVTKNFRTEDDVVAAVRGGFLSESDAMNRDD